MGAECEASRLPNANKHEKSDSFGLFNRETGNGNRESLSVVGEFASHFITTYPVYEVIYIRLLPVFRFSTPDSLVPIFNIRNYLKFDVWEAIESTLHPHDFITL